MRSLLFLFLFMGFGYCQAQFIIKGNIIDIDSELPIENVYVTIGNNQGGHLSNNLGNFEIRIATLPVLITFSHVSYEKKELHLSGKDFMQGKVKTINIELQSKYIETKSINVVDKKIFGQQVDTTPQINFIDFTIGTDSLIYALVARHKQTYLRVYNLNDSVLTEKQVDKRFEQIFNLPNEVMIGSEWKTNAFYDNKTEYYQTCYYENGHLVLLPEKKLPPESAWKFAHQANGFYYQSTHSQTRSIIYRSHEQKIEPDFSDLFYVSSHGGISVLYKEKSDYERIDKEWRIGGKGKKLEKYVKKGKNPQKDILTLEKEFIDSKYNRYFYKMVNVVSNNAEEEYNRWENLMKEKTDPFPVYRVPFIVIKKDTMFIVDLYTQQLIKLDTFGNHLSSIRLNKNDFQLYDYRSNILRTRIDKTFYSVSEKNGLTYICEFDMEKGSLGKKKYTLLRTARSVLDVRVHGDYVYYLAHYDTWRVGLFKEKIEYKNTEE